MNYPFLTPTFKLNEIHMDPTWENVYHIKWWNLYECHTIKELVLEIRVFLTFLIQGLICFGYFLKKIYIIIKKLILLF